MLRTFLGQLFLQAWRSVWRRDARGAPPPLQRTLRQSFDALLEADEYGRAQALAADAAARRTDSYEAWLMLGRAHQKLHEPARALECFDVALRLRGDDAELYDFRGSMLQELGRLQEAFADFDRALALRPDFPLAAFHLGMARLLAGDFERGWQGYELRRQGAGYETIAAGFPRWDGSPLTGRTLLVAREQGLGDEIMFASMLPELITQARHCVVECDPRLVATFRRSFPAATVVGTVAGGLPASVAPASIDVAIEAGSLPALLRRQASDFPRQDGYLRADPQSVARWRDRLAALGPGLTVGLAWSGGVRRTRRELRSIPLAQLLSLLGVPGCRFVSLQYTAGAREEIEALREEHGVVVHHWPEAIDDYDQTAALVCALDCVVSVCTAAVHLCGALGRPVLVLAPVGPEWRYGQSGEAMPWYRSVRIVRQGAYGEWGPVIAAAADELLLRARQRSAGTPPAR